MSNFKKGFGTTLGVIAAILTTGIITDIVNSLLGNKEKKSEEEKDN